MARNKNRSLRTVFLALFAVATFTGSAIFIFDVDPWLMLRIFVISLLGVAALALLALALTTMRVLIKRWLKR